MFFSPWGVVSLFRPICPNLILWEVLICGNYSICFRVCNLPGNGPNAGG
jgi:hypothetical protein